MPNFGSRSTKALASAHPELQLLFNEVIKGFDCAVLEGHRDEAKQAEAHRQGNTKLRFPHSKHNSIPSMAVDVVPWPLDWSDVQRFSVFAGYVLGVADMLRRQGRMTYPLRWGGDWNSDTQVKDERFRDMPHFELRGSI